MIEGKSAGTVTEDTEISTSGSLSLTDKDAGETRFVAESHKAHYGSLEIAESGSWTYTLDDRADALSEGSEVSDFVTVRAFDGTTQKIEVRITGTNDAAVIEGKSTGTVTEDTEISTSGSLSLTDKDAGEARFVAESHKGHYGSLEITENGSWTYTLDDRADALSEGSEVSDFVTVRAFDGTTQKIEVRITGHQRCGCY